MFSVLKTALKIALAAIVCISLVFPALPAAAAGHEVIAKGRINSHRLNLRVKPSRFSKVVIILERGDIVEVFEKQGGIGGWLKVRYEDYEGYLKNRPKYIKLLPKDAKVEIAAPPAAVKSAKAKQVIKKRKKIKEEIKKEQDKITTFSEEESRIIEGLNEIDYALNRARVNAASLSEDIDELKGKIKEIKQKEKKLSKALKKNTAYTGKRLDALYRLNMIGRLEIAGTPQSVFDFFLKQNAMKRVIQSDFDLIETQTRDMDALTALEKDLEEQHTIKKDLEQELGFQIRIKEKESQKKETILKDIRNQKKLSLAAVASLKAAAIDLDQRIEKFRRKADNPTAGKPITRYKGKLKFPVKGKIISRYGKSKADAYGSMTFQSGIDIRIERGEPVRCVFNGEVLFAEWLKGYGNVMIINHGEHYYSLYAHVEEIFKKPGEKVQTGEVIATAGDTGSIKGLCLHFEMRHHGKPVNPLRWLRKGA